VAILQRKTPDVSIGRFVFLERFVVVFISMK
jgi:hypothetical protein